MAQTFRTTISLRPEGSSSKFLIERQMYISNDQWKTIDRYTTSDLTAKRKSPSKWLEGVSEIFTQPAVDVVIEMPPQPQFEKPIVERLTDELSAAQNELKDVKNQLKDTKYELEFIKTGGQEE